MTVEERTARYIDSVARAVTLDEVAAVRPRLISAKAVARRRRLPALAAAVTLIAGTAAALVYARADAPVQVFGEETGPLGRVGTWMQVPDPDGVLAASDVVERVDLGDGSTLTGRSGIQVRAVEHLSDGFVAVGREKVGLRSLAAMWRSPDGVAWERVDGGEAFGGLDHELGDFGPSGWTMTSAAERADVVLVAGEDNTRETVRPVVWRSARGGPWERYDLAVAPASLVTAVGVTSTAEGFVMVGIDNGNQASGAQSRIVAWRSDDGVRWTSAGSEAFEPGSSASDVVTVAGAVIVVGQTGGSSGTAAGWRSDDAGRTWQKATVTEASSELPMSSMQRVAVGPRGLVAVGERRSADQVSFEGRSGQNRRINGDAALAVWSSVDGRRWEELRASDGGRTGAVELAPQVTWGGAGFVITAAIITVDDQAAATWTLSDDGKLASVDGPDQAPIVALGGNASTYVAVTDAVITDLPGEPKLWRLPVE